MEKKKIRKNILFRIAVFVFIVYVGVTIVNLQIRISNKQSEIETIKAQYTAQISLNNEAKRLLDTDSVEQFTENIARDDLDYAKPGERVFINASGN